MDNNANIKQFRVIGVINEQTNNSLKKVVKIFKVEKIKSTKGAF